MSEKTKQQLRDYADANRNTSGTNSLTGATENVMWNDVIDSMALEAELPGSEDYINLTPLDISPPYVEGNVWYDNNKKTLAYQNEVDGVELNIGETWLRVINNSGVNIPNGSVVRSTGSDAPTSLPTIELALADTFANAFTIGITTHDINIGEIGYVTTNGDVGGIDTSHLTAGKGVYLSETIPGALTSTPPSIASVLGLCLSNNATTGKVFVSVQNLLNFPGSIGILQELNNPAYQLTGGVSVPLTDWVDHWEITMIVDPITGTIVLPDVAGFYRVSVTCQVSFASQSSTRTLTLTLANDTLGTSEFSYVYNIPRDATSSSFSFQFPFADDTNSAYIVNVLTDDNETITFNKISFDIESSHLRQKTI